MSKLATKRALLSRQTLSRIVAIAALTIGSIGAAGVALGDDPPPPADDTPHGHRHRNDPAWAACKSQADEKKLEPGDARREFMKTCMKSAKSSTVPPA